MNDTRTIAAIPTRAAGAQPGECTTTGLEFQARCQSHAATSQNGRKTEERKPLTTAAYVAAGSSEGRRSSESQANTAGSARAIPKAIDPTTSWPSTRSALSNRSIASPVANTEELPTPVRAGSDQGATRVNRCGTGGVDSGYKVKSELAEAGLKEATINTYVGRAETFLRWLNGTYQPRGPNT